MLRMRQRGCRAARRRQSPERRTCCKKAGPERSKCGGGGWRENEAMTTDRDRSIERLLRQTPVAERHGPGACPDAETLAALADDALTDAVRREIEGHVADCHRCQALTAAMVRAETSVHATAGAVVPWWRGGAVKWLPAPAPARAAGVPWGGL